MFASCSLEDSYLSQVDELKLMMVEIVDRLQLSFFVDVFVL